MNWVRALNGNITLDLPESLEVNSEQLDKHMKTLKSDFYGLNESEWVNTFENLNFKFFVPELPKTVPVEVGIGSSLVLLYEGYKFFTKK